MKTIHVAALPLLCVLAVLLAGCAQPEIRSAPNGPRWFKGNLHTHTFWSDGQDFPEMVVDWYKKRGYDFLALSDHNILSEGDRWVDIRQRPSAGEALDKYVKRFGEGWVEQRHLEGRDEVRLKPLNEFRSLFEEGGRFLLIQAEEITDSKTHLNGINLAEVIPPQGGETAFEQLQNNVNAVLEQRRRTGRLMFPHINHPNYKWALTAEDLAPLKGEKFFEVYNGIGAVHNAGDEIHASTDRLWDIVLTRRLAELGLPVLFGIATDDAHEYGTWGPNRANPGRGWVMVGAHQLTPESIIKSMEAGNFYASTGVLLKNIQFDGRQLKVVIETEPGVSYVTEFIGTLKGYDRGSRPVLDEQGNPVRATHIYSDDIGRVLAEVEGKNAVYTLAGNEIYVRAKVTSTKPKDNAPVGGEVEVAWVQPVVPQAR